LEKFARDCKTRLIPRVGDGLSVLRDNEVELVSILGVGTFKIQEILHSREFIDQKGISKFVLQPSPPSLIQMFKLRRFLYMNQIDIVKESLIYDSGYFYSILAAKVLERLDLEEQKRMQKELLNNQLADFSCQDLYLGKNVESDLATESRYYSKWIDHIDQLLSESKNKKSLDSTSSNQQNSLILHEKFRSLLQDRLLKRSCNIQ
jgi:tRNA A22 N-methylase